MDTATAPALPATEAPVPGAAIASPAGFRVDLIPLRAIRPSPNNPRRIQPDDDPGLVELAASIRQHGVIQPIVVREFNSDELLGLPKSECVRYELVAGERRWHASRLAGADSIPAVVRADLDATAALELTVTENLQREDLHPLEEAAGVQALMDRAGWTAEAVADRLGRPLSWVVRRARLRTLTAGWREAMETDWEVSQWSVTHLELVARLEPAMQDRYLHEEFLRQQRSRWNGQEKVRSPREVALELAEYTRELSRTPWERDDVTLEPVAGACSACPKRSSCTPGLFDEEEELLDQAQPIRGDRCLDRACWERKTSAHVIRLKTQARAQYGDRLVLVTTTTTEKPPAGERWVNHWNAPTEGKGGKVPCLVVTGPSAGRFYLGIARRDEAKAKPPAKKAKPGEPATSLEERQAKLALRRRAHAIRALQSTLRGTKVRQPADHLVIAFAASFGTQGRATQGIFYGLDQSPSQPAAALFDRLGAEREPAIARLWLMVRPVIVENLEVYGLDQVDRYWEVAKRVAAATSISLAELLEAAEVAIPTPRAWSVAGPPAKTPAKRGGGRKLAAKAKGKGKAAGR